MSTKEERALWRMVRKVVPIIPDKSLRDLIDRSQPLNAAGKRNLRQILMYWLCDRPLTLSEVIEFYGLNDE